MHFVLSVEGTLRASAGTTSAEAAGVVTAPDVEHAIDAGGGDVLLVFLDPESDAGRRLVSTLTTPVRWITAAERDALVRDSDPQEIIGPKGAAWTERAVEILGGEQPAAQRLMHPRVRKLLRLVAMRPVDDESSLDALATEVGLSPSRLMHVFTESLGIPLRPYLAWLKLQRAAHAISTGRPLADAAYAAGFADAAHMTRTFRKMFGVTPSSLRPQRATHGESHR
jgi:AraC-like DNA-binding protein